MVNYCRCSSKRHLVRTGFATFITSVLNCHVYSDVGDQDTLCALNVMGNRQLMKLSCNVLGASVASL